MTKPENENLFELLNRFMDEGAARDMARDIEKGDELLSLHPAPQPSDKVLEEIKSRIALTLKHRRTASVIRQRVWVAAGVAAILVIGVFSSLRLWNSPTTKLQQVQIASAVWDGSDDADIAVLKAEVETIQNTLSGVQVDDNAGSNGLSAGDLEMELIEIGSDIWKG